MQGRSHHTHSLSETVNHRAQLARAYQELGKELSSTKIRLLGNYTLGKVIGEGTYGKVRIGTHRLTSTRVAIKQIPKEMSAQLTREIHHHRRLHHPYVTQLYEVLATESSIWLVTELCSGGELFDYLAEKGRLSEEESKRIFGQLCLAMHYVHGSGAVHRDLKLENVLLDDRCNVKLGDFGFTREFEQGRLLETFCGTTGYAAPEMLLGQKYSGPEVDIWSLGIILHCLLTGTLPFDDDDEDVMKAKIIAGTYEESEWLSDNARDLIRGILRKSPADRLTISQMLAHPWFSEEDPPPLSSPPPLDLNYTAPVNEEPANKGTQNPVPFDIAAAVTDALREQIPMDGREASESSSTTSDAQQSGTSDDNTDLTSVTTPDIHESPVVPAIGFDQAASMLDAGVSRSGSQSTLGPKRDGLRTQPASKISLTSRQSDTTTVFAAVAEEGEDDSRPTAPTLSRNGSLKRSSAPPSAFPTRTPARTKRRSVSSTNISAPTSPTEPSFPAGVGAGPIGPSDYSTLLAASAPLLFSTPLERGLLNSLSTLGFDTGQIVHSVLTDACDSCGAIWWLLKKKAERREIVEARRVAEERRKTFEALDDSTKRISSLRLSPSAPFIGDTSLESMFEHRPPSSELFTEGRNTPAHEKPLPSLLPSLSQEADSSQSVLFTPHISFVPPTPSTELPPEPRTPPQQAPISSASSATLGMDLDGSLRSIGSSPSTPGTPKEKRPNKPRSGSISMLQRAAGLVRKKSEEKVREKDREKEEAADAATASNKSSWGRASESTTASHNTHASSTHSTPGLSHSVSFPSGHKLQKSPPGAKGKGKDREVDFGHQVASSLTPGSPFTSVDSARTPTQPQSQPQPSASRQVFKLTSPSFLSTHVEDQPTETFSETNSSKGRGQRGSIFNTFRTWFQEDKKKGKGKGKALASPLTQSYPIGANPSSPSARSRSAIYKASRKRASGFGHDKRPSISSRRSSSVNSRRSSITSIPSQRRPSDFMIPQMSPESMQLITRQRSDASRRSLGTRTPSSEIGSRPSSIRSFNRTPRARPNRARSPSQSSTGSSRARQTASPMYHRRLGSGSSSRVVRQVHMVHNRNNSQASSTRSSRHNSFDIATGSPDRDFVGRDIVERSITPARERKQSTTVFVAKQSNVFGAPSNARLATYGRSSWKKSWGVEPPGWQSRAAHAPVETFSDPGHGGSLRDVFTGRQSLDPNDESDWVDEDDDSPAFAGGLGQLPALIVSGMASNSASTSALPPSPSLRGKHELPVVMMGGSKSRPPTTKRTRPSSAPVAPRLLQAETSSSRNATLRASPTPPLLTLAAEASTVITETAHLAGHGPGSRARRPMQGGRTGGPSFQNPIQEEDEDEE